MERRQHSCSQDDIHDILFGSDENENELDEIEPEFVLSYFCDTDPLGA